MDDKDALELLKTLDGSPHIIGFDLRNNKIKDKGTLHLTGNRTG